MSSFSEDVPTDEEIDGLGIKALRELIVRAGLSHADWCARRCAAHDEGSSV